ncbi:MAG: NAD-dependent epimerase/dehydratase family protein [Chitinophagaceae bacterium]
MKKILVTGATGFIGHYVINELLGKGYSVVATSRTEQRAEQCDWFDKVHYVPFDLHEAKPQQNYYQLFGQPDAMIHLAWEGLPNYKSAFHIHENLPRHIGFLTNLLQNGLKDLTVIGTCFEYGMQEGCLSEEMPAMPSNAYATAKDDLRKYLEEYAQENMVSFKWVRLFYMYGKGQNPKSLLSQLQAAIDNGDEVFNMSPGDQLRDYLPVEKVAGYIVKIAVQQKVMGIINCCSGVPVSVKQLVLDYLEEKKAEIRLNTGFYPYPDIEPKNFWGDTSKFKTLK